jgi:hypothetical protein
MGPGLLVARIVLACVFFLAAVSKLADLAGSRRAAAAFGVPDRFAGVVGVGLPLCELAVAVALVPAGSARFGALGALVLVAGFLVVISSALVRGETPDCHCFGQVHSAPVGWRTLARNAGLLAVAGFVAVAGWDHAGRPRSIGGALQPPPRVAAGRPGRYGRVVRLARSADWRVRRGSRKALPTAARKVSISPWGTGSTTQPSIYQPAASAVAVSSREPHPQRAARCSHQSSRPSARWESNPAVRTSRACRPNSAVTANSATTQIRSNAAPTGRASLMSSAAAGRVSSVAAASAAVTTGPYDTRSEKCCPHGDQACFKDETCCGNQACCGQNQECCGQGANAHCVPKGKCKKCTAPGFPPSYTPCGATCCGGATPVCCQAAGGSTCCAAGQSCCGDENNSCVTAQAQGGAWCLTDCDGAAGQTIGCCPGGQAGTCGTGPGESHPACRGGNFGCICSSGAFCPATGCCDIDGICVDPCP